MEPLFSHCDSHLAYLEPPHSHDPSSVSAIASLPTSILNELPASTQLALYNLQQSTSIVYASFTRLQELLQERFDRLLPSSDAKGATSFSESSFFTYSNSLRAEQTYLLFDAHPDWRHKASVAHVAIQPHHNLCLDLEHAPANAPCTVLQWWDCLQSAVASWCEYARVVHVPEYEDTIGEYLAVQKQTPALTMDLDETPWETPLAMPTPPLGYEPEPFQICQIEDKDFESLIPFKETLSKELSGLGLLDAVDVKMLKHPIMSGFPLETTGPRCNIRKDSGVGMVH